MFNAHPILGMCISDEYEIPHLIKGSEPKITVEDNVDEDCITEFLTKPFNLKESLCRFLIHEKEDSNTLYASFHHIIFDALSDSTFKRDLQQLLEGKTPNVDDSFLKVAAFKQEIQKTKEYTKAENFYETMLADCDEAEPLLNSPLADGPDTYSLDLNFNHESYKTFLNENGISENVLFTGVFAYTLSRFVGNNKALFNIIDNGRDRFDNYNAIGMFINTLPLLVDCKNQNIRSFMDNTSNLVYNVMRYNYYPFRLLANKYNIDSNILFQFMPDWIKDDESINIYSNPIQDMNDLIADLSVGVIQKGDKYNLSITYSDKYSQEFIKSLASSYELILNGMLNANSLSDINYTLSSDLDIMDAFNQNEKELKYADILDAFNDNLVKYPNNKLVSLCDNSYSYCEGAFIADALAKNLIRLGVDSQEYVPFLVERSELYMLCILGILSMGGVFVPLDDKLPNERLSFILNDTDANVVIVSDETYERAEGLVDENVVLINISNIVKGTIGNLSSLPICYGNLACILYTSGTTGIPKGVKITRKSVLNLAEYYCNQYGLSNEDVYALYSSIGFDAGPQAIFQTIYAGACLSVVPEDTKFNIRDLNEYFIKENVTYTFISTQVSKIFMETTNETSLKSLSVGGEKLSDFKHDLAYDVIDEFGPTEAFAFISSINASLKIDPSSIGYLNYNSKAYILDENQHRVPIGAVGELCVAGFQIADGYFNRAGETSKSFIDNPFCNDEGYGVLYRTGDIARVLPDGSLGLVGRRDGQVKIRGNRVELSEVETAIRELDYVDDVTVQTVLNGSNNELVAYVVSSRAIEDVDLRKDICDYVSVNKPDYMVPSFVVALDAIPLTVNGKVDKGALPKVDTDSLHADYVEPMTKMEMIIVDAFEKVFNQEKIGVHDDFINLGGDSLSAIKIKALIDLDFDVRTILKARTPYKIAQYIEENKGEYGFELIRKGTKDQNMFLFPDVSGLSYSYLNFIKNIDFEGNIYIIDDYKYELTLEEIRKIDEDKQLIDHYYDAIKDVFNDGDIIVAYSSGCINSALVAEKLEKDKDIEKCILIDGTLDFINDTTVIKEEIRSQLMEDYGFIFKYYPQDYVEKLLEIYLINMNLHFHTPKNQFSNSLFSHNW